MTRTHSSALGNVWTPGAGRGIDMHYDFPIEAGRKNVVALVWATELDSPVSHSGRRGVVKSDRLFCTIIWIRYKCVKLLI